MRQRKVDGNLKPLSDLTKASMPRLRCVRCSKARVSSRNTALINLDGVKYAVGSRFYSPKTNQSAIYWANKGEGQWHRPAIGGVMTATGIRVIYNDTWGSRAILTRTNGPPQIRIVRNGEPFPPLRGELDIKLGYGIHPPIAARLAFARRGQPDAFAPNRVPSGFEGTAPARATAACRGLVLETDETIWSIRFPRPSDGSRSRNLSTLEFVCGGPSFSRNNEPYVVYGDPNQLFTSPALFVKLIRYSVSGMA